ncbi:hypothetical protein [Sphingopyxis sp. RIFCSPHIGHO2_12_FULL_65_19]|uniref:hypothetical protein n=1 Tax=Sphingopyxis sp. RIFCSPHIGHO2_12_FULL_65_19 TaxID=1802172 RepID=UPI0008C042FF|nr:hypothetical protein [Sphingopyxis sp. RIFCSPHIGHO2_12_FULL_65_19]OHD07572.1 MAG: hypothetical protein A3E77_09325 [Sphingopyxis sp. RIFCSPHIGHO2_12_FULL_65_19]
MRTYEHIAYLLMLMLKESGKARFRLSRKSLQIISGRDVIKTALIRNIAEWMEGVAVILPLNRGGYVVISQESLEGIAPMKIAEAVPNWREISIDDLRTQIDSAGEDDDED